MVQLYKGDCLELMKQIPNGSIDAIILRFTVNNLYIPTIIRIFA